VREMCTYCRVVGLGSRLPEPKLHQLNKLPKTSPIPQPAHRRAKRQQPRSGLREGGADGQASVGAGGAGQGWGRAREEAERRWRRPEACSIY
jgi:hypothetical protein